jgi:MoaA/NifB/PqqE/SkfB family radical SAM enzyme
MNEPVPLQNAAAAKGAALAQAPGLFYAQGQQAEKLGMVAQAIACYQIALKLNPAHGDSIAALGRLRFAAPEQPYMNELRSVLRDNVSEVTIEVRNPCNYRCSYCVAAGHNNVPVQMFDFEPIKAFYEGLKDNLIVTALECEGGEPTVHPQFPELIRMISSYGAVSFPSNNSQNPERWLPKETASRLVIRSSLHPQAEEDLPKYLKHARYLLDAGVHFTTTFVSHPSRMDKIADYKKQFAEAGVPFTPVGFIGLHDGKKYPNMYTDEEKALIGLTDSSRYWMHQIEPHVTRVRRFRGIPCLAGYQSFYLTNKGTIRRCAYDKRPLDGPLKEAKPCGVKICGCGLQLEKLNSLNTGEFFNSWASIAGAKPLDINFDKMAQNHGYENVNEAMTKEQILMYDALMAAYGKDEFIE